MTRRFAHALASLPARVIYGVRAAVAGPERPTAAYWQGQIEILEGLLRAACAGREKAEHERDALAAELACLRARRAYLDGGPVVRRSAVDGLFPGALADDDTLESAADT